MRVSFEQNGQVDAALLFKKVVSLVLIILLALGSVSCSSEVESLQSSINQLNQQKNSLNWQLQNTKEQLENISINQARSLFKIAQLHDSVKAYELFLQGVAELYISPQNNQSKEIITSLQQRSIHRIYELTKKADLIEGYRYFLKNHQNAPEAKEVNRRVYEIFYKISENKGTLPAYLEFISNFEGAPEDLRNNALDKAIALECQALNREYQEIVATVGDSYKSDHIVLNLVKKSTINELGNRLFQGAISARDSGDEVAFSEKYNTIFRCSLFDDSDKRFELQINKDLKAELIRIQDGLKKIREDIAQSSSVILRKLDGVDKAINQQDLYIQEISNLVKEQTRLLANKEKPFSWDDQESAWDNFVRMGLGALEVVQSVKEALEVPAAMIAA